jgi:hypothetical protein
MWPATTMRCALGAALLWTVMAVAACSGSVDAPSLDQLAVGDDDTVLTGGDHDAPADHGDPLPADADTDAGGDAAPSDNDPPGADTGPDMNPCTNGEAVFCDDFEADSGGAAPGGPWNVSTHKGTVSVSSAKAYSGTKSLKCTTTSSSSDADKYRQAFVAIGEDDAPITGNQFYGRMMVWFGRIPPNNGLHWTNVSGSGQVTTEKYDNASFSSSYNYGGQYSHLMANYNSGGGPASDCWQHSDTILPAQTWHCMEWQFDGPNQTMKLWINGTAIDAVTVIDQGQGCIAHDLGDRWVAPQFDTIRLGWEHYQDIDYDVELYVDDVALGPTRLGCP